MKKINKKRMKASLKSRIRLFFRKIYYFEYWPYWIFYIPLLFYALYLALRARSLTYFSCANPNLKYSGAFDMSKKDILAITPEKFLPITSFIEKQNLSKENILKIVSDKGIKYPFILKPNIGERGMNVARIMNDQELDVYLKCCNEDTIIQEYLGYETHQIEAGVFITRNPKDNKVVITNFAFRKFQTVTGNGKSKLYELIDHSPRAIYKFEYYKKRLKRFTEVIPENEEVLLDPIGSHNRGNGFIDKDHLITLQLKTVFTEILESLPEFYYGRFDIKAKSLEDIYNGNFRILEINGINAEPISIYDPNCSLIKAYRVVVQHMKLIYIISKYNHKHKNLPYVPFIKFAKDAFKHLENIKQKSEI